MATSVVMCKVFNSTGRRVMSPGLLRVPVVSLLGLLLTSLALSLPASPGSRLVRLGLVGSTWAQSSAFPEPVLLIHACPTLPDAPCVGFGAVPGEAREQASQQVDSCRSTPFTVAGLTIIGGASTTECPLYVDVTPACPAAVSAPGCCIISAEARPMIRYAFACEPTFFFWFVRCLRTDTTTLGTVNYCVRATSCGSTVDCNAVMPLAPPSSTP